MAFNRSLDFLLDESGVTTLHEARKTLGPIIKKLREHMHDVLGAKNDLQDFGIITEPSLDGSEELVKGFRFLARDYASARKASKEGRNYLKALQEALEAQANAGSEAEPGDPDWIKKPIGTVHLGKGKFFETKSAHVLSSDVKNFIAKLTKAGGSVISENEIVGGETIKYQMPIRRDWGSEKSANLLFGDVASGFEDSYKKFRRERKNERERQRYAEHKAYREALGADVGEAEARRAAQMGYVPTTLLDMQDEKRKKLGIITDEGEGKPKEDVSSGIERMKFFAKGLSVLTAILAVTQKIFSAVWKITEQAIKTSYEAMSYGVNADVLQSFRNALDNNSIPVEEANKAIGAVVGGLINPFTLDAGLIKKLAPVLGTDLAGTVKQMLSKQEDPIGALQVIMDSARRQVNDPNSMWTLPKMVNQLGTFGPAFAGYMRWLYKQENPADKTFYDFIGYDPAKYVDEAAEGGIQIKEFINKPLHWLQNAARSIVGGSIYYPGAKGVYKRLGIDPNSMSLEDLINALKFEDNPDIMNYYHKFGTGYDRSTGAPLYRKELNKDLNTLERMLEEIERASEKESEETATTSMLTNPSGDLTGTAVERLAYGYGAGSYTGGTVYNEINNNTDNSIAGAATGGTNIDLHVLIGDKDGGTFPLQIGANNMITVGWS